MQRDSIGRWSGPVTSYVVWGLYNSQIDGEGLVKALYRLDLPQSQAELFSSYKLITNRSEAEAWCRKFGFPAYEPKSFDETMRASENLDAMIESARMLRAMESLEKAIAAASLDLRFDLLKSMVLEVPTFKGQPITYFQFKDLKWMFSSDGTSLSREEQGFREWKRKDEKSLLESARSVLLEIGNKMLENVKPQLEWRQDLYGQRYISTEYAILCPWHAIASEFVRRISDRMELPKLCPHPDCGKLLERKRFGAKSCGNHRCRKWVQRHPSN